MKLRMPNACATSIDPVDTLPDPGIASWKAIETAPPTILSHLFFDILGPARPLPLLAFNSLSFRCRFEGGSDEDWEQGSKEARQQAQLTFLQFIVGLFVCR